MTWRVVPCTGELTLGDHRRYPGSRVLLTCDLCGWTKSYAPERVVDRLRALKTGGYLTRVGTVARRVAWPCPACGRVKWRADLAWPPGLEEREVKRLANLYRD